ncbi:MAG: phytanoyl-CoA dioxygenase family protein [Planctomycetota bacterium]
MQTTCDAIPVLARDADPATVLEAWQAAGRPAGCLIVRGVMLPQKLQVLKAETTALIERVAIERPRDGDHFYNRAGIPWRIEWVIDKLTSYRAAYGNPRLLRVVETLLGPECLPHSLHTLVFKAPGGGAPVGWHRDWQARPPGFPEDWHPAQHLAACSLALDPWLPEDGMWFVPGSHLLPPEEAQEAARAQRQDFGSAPACPAPLEPGDLLIHNHYCMHGSQAGTGASLRRGLQCTFWSKDLYSRIEDGWGADLQREHRQRVLASCLWLRSLRSWAAQEERFVPAAVDPSLAPLPEPVRCRSRIWHYAAFDRRPV